MKRNTKKERKVYKMHLAGMSTYVIAQELKMRQPFVHRIIKRVKRELAPQLQQDE